MSNKSPMPSVVGPAFRRRSGLGRRPRRAYLTNHTTGMVPGFRRTPCIPHRWRMLDDPGQRANNLGPIWYPDVIVEMGDFRAAAAAFRGNRLIRCGRDEARRPCRARAHDPDLA